MGQRAQGKGSEVRGQRRYRLHATIPRAVAQRQSPRREGERGEGWMDGGREETSQLTCCLGTLASCVSYLFLTHPTERWRGTNGTRKGGVGVRDERTGREGKGGGEEERQINRETSQSKLHDKTQTINASTLRFTEKTETKCPLQSHKEPQKSGWLRRFRMEFTDQGRDGDVEQKKEMTENKQQLTGEPEGGPERGEGA